MRYILRLTSSVGLYGCDNGCMSVFEIAPTIKWTLDDWRSVAGHPSAADMIRIGQTLTGPDIVTGAIANWRAGTVQTWFRNAIVERDHAVAMITVLRHAARAAGSTLFSDEHLRAHADYFMRSKACRDGGFTPLSGDELAAIAVPCAGSACGRRSRSVRRFSDAADKALRSDRESLTLDTMRESSST